MCATAVSLLEHLNVVTHIRIPEHIRGSSPVRVSIGSELGRIGVSRCEIIGFE